MATITAAAPQPTGEVLPVAERELEKYIQDPQNIYEVSDDLKTDSDSNSQIKQDGVKRVEVITTVWSKQVLVLMFVLYVHDVKPLQRQTNLITGYISSASATSCFSQYRAALPPT